MEPDIRKEIVVLDDILNNAHKYHFHQLLFILERILVKDDDVEFDKFVKIRPDDSLGFPASDVCSLNSLGVNRFEVIARFSGLYGVDSPLPQYFLDEVTEGGDSGKRLGAFLDIFNNRLYSLLHQVWKKQNPFTQLDEKGLYYRLVSAVSGQYWQRNTETIAFGGCFLGNTRNTESLEEVLKESIQINDLKIDSEVISWVPIEDGLILNGNQALGLDTCLGDKVPMLGKKIGVNIGPVDLKIAQAVQPQGEMGHKLATLLRQYLPEGVDFDVSIQLIPKLKQDWVLGSEASQLAVHTQFGESSGRGLVFKLSSDQYQRVA